MNILSAIPLISKAIDKIFPDKTEAERAKAKMFELQQQGELAELDAELQLALGQMGINTQEAKSSSLFIAGWRPSVGWICAFAVGWTYILHPIVSWFAVLNGMSDAEVPELDVNQLMVLLLGMLGIGGMRSIDKRNHVDTKEIT